MSSRVAQRRFSRQSREDMGLKNIGDQAHAFFHVQLAPIARNDSRGFLSAMLQRVETQIGELRGFGMAENAAHSAVIMKPVIFNFDQMIHSAFRRFM
jgi:hypothetical protein